MILIAAWPASADPKPASSDLERVYSRPRGTVRSSCRGQSSDGRFRPWRQAERTEARDAQTSERGERSGPGPNTKFLTVPRPRPVAGGPEKYSVQKIA